MFRDICLWDFCICPNTMEGNLILFMECTALKIFLACFEILVNWSFNNTGLQGNSTKPGSIATCISRVRVLLLWIIHNMLSISHIGTIILLESRSNENFPRWCWWIIQSNGTSCSGKACVFFLKLWAPQIKFQTPPLSWRSRRNLTFRHHRHWAYKTKTNHN